MRRRRARSLHLISELFFRFDSVLFVSLQEFLDSGILLAQERGGGLADR